MNRKSTIRIISILLVVWLCLMVSITVYASSAQERTPEISSFEELNGKTISMLTGTLELISSKVPAEVEYTYYSTSADMALALTSGKTDAFLQNTAIGELFVNKNLSLALFSEPLKESEFGIAFSKNIPTSVNGRLHMTKYVPNILRNCGINGQDLMRV